MKSPKKRSKSVLHGQNKSDFFLNHKYFFILTCLILICFALFYCNQKKIYLSLRYPWSGLLHYSPRTASKNAVDIRIQYPAHSYHASDLSILAALLKGTLNIANIDFLGKTVKIAHNYGIVDKISVKKTGMHLYDVHLTPKVPILCVQMDSLRLTTEKGQIYGIVHDRSKCPNGIINGIFEANLSIPIRLNSDRNIIVSSEDMAIIMESIDLLKTLKANNFALKTDVNFERSRGFAIQLAVPPIEVIFGRGPFGAKSARLNRIILNKHESNIERIELDFKEKAFIKYLKPST